MCMQKVLTWVVRFWISGSLLVTLQTGSLLTIAACAVQGYRVRLPGLQIFCMILLL